MVGAPSERNVNTGSRRVPHVVHCEFGIRSDVSQTPLTSAHCTGVATGPDGTATGGGTGVATGPDGTATGGDAGVATGPDGVATGGDTGVATGPAQALDVAAKALIAARTTMVVLNMARFLCE